MFNPFAFLVRRSQRWVYPLISLTVVLGLWLGQPLASQAISWGDLILRGIQVIQLSNLSDRQEVELGRQINDRLVGGQIRLLRDPQINRYVNAIGQRLAAESNRTNIPYTFQVVNDRGVNAFATMGGFIYINAGLMQAANNEAELASVMGHEIAHITARHAVKQMKETAIARGLAGAAGLDRSTAVNIGLELALRRPHSRNAEYEADQLGLRMLGRAGYAQSAAVDFMKKLMRQPSLPAFFSTHPAPADRVTRMQAAIDPRMVNGNGMDNSAYRSRLRSLD
jgi:predicted Zn-dependent protease